MSVSTINALILGAERSVGYWLSRRLTLESHICRGQSLESWERLSLQGINMPFYIILPSLHAVSDLDNVSYWVDQAQEQDAPVVFLSSLAVFDFESERLHSESDHQFSSSDLANKLLTLEEKVRQSRRHIILRTGEGVSLRDGDLAHSMLATIRNSRTLIADDTLSFYPTADDDVADVITAILKQASCSDELWGTYHFCGIDKTTAYRFSEALLSEVGQYEDFSDVQLRVADSSESSSITPVPGSDNTKLFHTFGIKAKPWRSGLGRLSRFYYRMDQDQRIDQDKTPE